MWDKQKIEHYIAALRADEHAFMHGVASQAAGEVRGEEGLKTKRTAVFFIFRSLLDFLQLRFLLLFSHFQNKRIVYTSSNFSTTENGVVEDRIVKPLFTDNILFINQSKEVYLPKMNQQKVYNVGGVAKLLSFFSKAKNPMMRYFEGHQTVNKWLLSGFENKEIYLMYYYELNSLSIIFSDFRSKLKLVEVQHGSMINYPPYVRPAPVKVIDVFYVKNSPTIGYLKEHLCKGFECEYHLIPYPKNATVYKEGISILYASTLELNGLHPVFYDFLKTTGRTDLTVKIRLHPREQNPETEQRFTEQMNDCGIAFTFDTSKNWLEAISETNLIVISAWSSILEEAFDNGFKAIIIDPMGAKRFDYLLGCENFIFAKELSSELLITK